MEAKAIVYMFSGATAEAETTRAALADFWQRRQNDICAAVIDINLTRWIYTYKTGWERATKFRYVPDRPDLWKHEPTVGDLKPTTDTPFDRA